MSRRIRHYWLSTCWLCNRSDLIQYHLIHIDTLWIRQRARWWFLYFWSVRYDNPLPISCLNSVFCSSKTSKNIRGFFQLQAIPYRLDERLRVKDLSCFTAHLRMVRCKEDKLLLYLSLMGNMDPNYQPTGEIVKVNMERNSQQVGCR